MKLSHITLTVLVLGLLSCSQKQEGVIITGAIRGGDIQEVEYITPINGKWFYGDKKTISTDSMGLFKMEMDIAKPSFVTLYVPGRAGGILLVEPDKTYDIKFDFESEQRKVYITALDSTGQNFYNTLPAPDYNMMGLREFYNDSIPRVIASKINSLKEKEIFQLDELLKKNVISEDFYELAILDRKVYFSALEAGAAGLLLQKYRREKELRKIDSLLNFWDEKLKISNITENEYDRSPWFYVLVSNHIRFAQLSSTEYDSEILSKAYNSGDIYQYNIDEAKKYLGGEELEYYLASYIFYESWQTKDNSKKIIDVYENFKQEYSQSAYNEHLDASIVHIVTFHKNLENAKANEKIVFVKNYEKIDSFEDLIANFNGKKVFVDIWGTWCAPCKREFEEKETLDKLLNSKEIVPLYICEGQISKEKVWKEMIQSYNLEGYHLLSNEQLLGDIINEFGKNGQFAYPRYLLVNEKGEVVNAETSYPSNIGQLEKEIDENFL